MIPVRIRQEIRPRLRAAFRDRLRDVLVYGSEARGEAREDSDLDLLVVLSGPVRLGKDLEAIVKALYPLQLEIDRPIHALPVSAEAFEAEEFSLYRNIKQEGVAV
ncbi:MAG TPA: nucleotidyltransferase domain-containing protein [Thermoanaerobaculia bacterium]|nr:nucleotidyltransferase domain-containing protein [Thermoanaerobaculia bacterium]